MNASSRNNHAARTASGRFNAGALWLLVACISCTSRADNTRTAATDSPAVGTAAATTTLTTEPALDSVRAAIRLHNLTRLADECLDFIRETAQPPLVSYTVRERHGGSCAGDPGTSPRLFTIAADTATWTLSTDAGSTTATMRPLVPTPK